MQTVKIFQLKNLSKTSRRLICEGQKEAARVWNFCVTTHKELREKRQPWPRKETLQKLTKGKFAIHSQSVQMVCHAFLANVDTAIQVKKTNKSMRLPYKQKVFYPLMWPKQAVKKVGKSLVLPMGRGRSSIKLPINLSGQELGGCKLVWNEGYELHISIENACLERDLDQQECLAAVDLGQIHLAAAVTETGKARIVTGRGIRSLKRFRSKALGKIAKKHSRCAKGSRRSRKLRRAGSKIKARIKRRIRDQRHQATASTIRFLKEEKITKFYVGNPKGIQKRRCGRWHNQRISQWEFAKDLHYLEYKSKKAGILCFNGTERGTSSCCPKCGHRKRVKGRNWRCPLCEFECHRDVVGGMNMFPLAFGKSVDKPKEITYLRPGNLRFPKSSSSLDTGQSCLAELEKDQSTSTTCVAQATDLLFERNQQEALSL
jgi:putative transposase